MTLRLGLAIAGVLLAGAAAGAQAPGGGPGRGGGFDGHRPPFERAFGDKGEQGRWWNNPKIAEQLKLTDAQRKSMDDILLAHREKLIDLRASLQKAELSLEPLVKADTPNEAGILAGIDKVASARAELEKANARYLLAIRSKLTPEQWKTVQDLRQHRGEQGRGMGPGRDGRGGQGGPGGQGHGGWNRGGQGPGGQGQGGPGMQYRHRQPPPPAGTAPAPGAAPAAPGPQTMDGGAGSDAAGASQGGAQQ
jgi:Spy/CpxP family protein refolding chaperone